MQFYDLGFGRADSQAPPLEITGNGSLVPNLPELSVHLLQCLGSMLISNSLFKIELVSQESARWFSYIKPLSR